MILSLLSLTAFFISRAHALPALFPKSPNFLVISEESTFISLNIPSMKLKGSSAFIESVKMLNPSYKAKSEIDLKKEILEENLRLLYVAITRAKRKLYFTCSKKQKNYYGKEEKIEENMIFNELLQTKVIN